LEHSPPSSIIGNLIGVYEFIKFGFGLSLLFLGIYFLWKNRKRNLILITFVSILLCGLIPAQIVLHKRISDIIESPYSEYLTVRSCEKARELAKRDINNGAYKYFFLKDELDTDAFDFLKTKGVKIVDVSKYKSENLKCYNRFLKIIARSLNEEGFSKKNPYQLE
jgi:hypothetical protein